MKLLLTNDDGVDAEGLAALRAAAVRVGEPLVVAPAGPFSGCSHKVTTAEPFRVLSRDAGCLVVEGTPADCVRVALWHAAPDADWVLSGINHGGNLGADVHLSGTVAAVREGVLFGKPGIAVSQYHRKGVDLPDWKRAAEWVTPILRDLTNRAWTPGTFWNINLPHLPPSAPDPEVVFCKLDSSPLAVSYHVEGDLWQYNGIYHQRRREPGCDIDTCFGGAIAVTLVTVG